MLPRAVGQAVETVVTKVTKEWFRSLRRRAAKASAACARGRAHRPGTKERGMRPRASAAGRHRRHRKIACRDHGGGAERSVDHAIDLSFLSPRLDPYRR